jgi:hypothetical protein
MPLERAPLAFALVLAIPAYWQTHESFRDFEQRFHAEGSKAVLSFELESPESLILEIELTVRADTRVVFLVNETEFADLPADRLYAVRREKLFVSREAVGRGRNEILVETRGAPSSGFEMTARLHNYYGINPKFPRAFVVSDEAARNFFSGFSPLGRAARFTLFYVASLFVLSAASRLFHRSRIALAAPSIVLWGSLVYSLATPLHVFLSLGALAITTVTPLVVLALARRAWARRVLLVRLAAVSLVTLVVLEAAFRLYNRVRPSFVFYSDSYNRYRGHPGAPHFDSTLNSQGFLDVEPKARKEQGAFRIVAVGDSFALGVVPYESNYLTLLENTLPDRAGRGVEVLNMGIAATGPDDYLALLVNEGLSFEPDLVIAGFFIGNDFETRIRRPHEYSYVVTFFRFLWALGSSGRPMEHPGGTTDPYDDERPTLDRDRFLAIETDRARLYREGGTLAREIPRAVAALREMRAIAGRAGADFIVVLIPDEVQVDEALQREIVRAYRTTPDAFDFALPNRLLTERLSEEGIAFIDLLPVFLEESGGARLYKPQDTHWNLAGNRLAANAIARFLAERL